MFEVYVSKQNNDQVKRFIIPKNKGYNIFYLDSNYDQRK